MQLLVFEFLSILYFTLLNSDLRLGRLARKQRSLVLRHMPLTLTCSDYVVNLKASGVQERSPGVGCGGAKPPTHKKNVKKKKFQQQKILKNFLTFFQKFFFLKSSETYPNYFILNRTKKKVSSF